MELIILVVFIIFMVKSTKGQAIVNETAETAVVLSRTARKASEALERQVDGLLDDKAMEEKSNAAKAKLAKAAKAKASKAVAEDYSDAE